MKIRNRRQQKEINSGPDRSIEMIKVLKKKSFPGYRMRQCFRLMFEQWKSVLTNDCAHLILGNFKKIYFQRQYLAF